MERLFNGAGGSPNFSASANNLLRMKRILTPLVLLAALLAGCGGGSTTSSSSTTTSSASSPTSSTPSTSTAADTSVARRALVSAVRRRLSGAGLPADYTNCVLDKAQALPDAELRRLVAAGITQGSAAGQREGRSVGKRFGRECIRQGRGIAYFRAKFVQGIRSAAAGDSSVSRAFVDCIVRKARSDVPDSQLIEIALLSSEPNARPRAQAKGRAIGARLARKCVAEGVRP